MAALPLIEKGVSYSCDEEFVSECTIFPHGEANQVPGMLSLAIIESLKAATRGDKQFPAFSKAHISEVAKFIPNQNVHATHDQNVRPYFTQILSHLIQTDEHVYQLYIFDENCTKPPKSNVIDNAKEFKKNYPRQKVQSQLFLYGDRSLKNKSSVNAGNASGYELMLKQYSDYEIEDKSHTANPNVAISSRFVNMLLRGEAPAGLRVSVFVHPDCVNTIKDFTHLKTDGDGGKLMEYVTDAEGNKYEKHGHATDALRYMFCKMFERYYMIFKTGRPIPTGDARYN